jgi:hypothetical protein
MNWPCARRAMPIGWRATPPRIHHPCPAAGRPRSVHGVITSR